MKKLVITKENYESIMFGLLENEYSKEESENLFKQIEADTFLSFEWRQWGKAQFTEGLEKYKRDESEFIEGLIKTESKRGGIIRFIIPFAAAASIALFLLLNPSTDVKVSNDSGLISKISQQIENSDKNKIESQKTEVAHNNDNHVKIETTSDKAFIPESVSPQTNKEVKIASENPMESRKDEIITQMNLMEDSMKMMISKALAESNKPKSKYKVTVTEERMDGIAYENTVFNEKRYTMADVMVHKDGISLSKFLNNSKSKVIKDKNSNMTFIEYIAEDNSILVLQLSH